MGGPPGVDAGEHLHAHTGEVTVTGKNTKRVGEVEVGHGVDLVLLAIDGRYSGITQLTPDEAERLADRLREKAAEARAAKEG